jgi:type 1 fimbria pilin
MKGQKAGYAPLPTAVVVAMSILLAPMASLADDGVGEDEQGTLEVHGQLLEGACHLDMTSVFQQVELGAISRAQLLKPGDEGKAVPVHFTLRDCSRNGGEQIDRYTGSHFSDAIQPVVTLSFTGVTDADMPSLLKTSGVTGVGLKLIDPQGRRVQPGQRGEPMFITPGDNDLVYTLVPVRTPAPLTTGAFRAVTNVEVSYD